MPVAEIQHQAPDEPYEFVVKGRPLANAASEIMIELRTQRDGTSFFRTTAISSVTAITTVQRTVDIALNSIKNPLDNNVSKIECE